MFDVLRGPARVWSRDPAERRKHHEAALKERRRVDGTVPGIRLPRVPLLRAPQRKQAALEVPA
ncbi:MAG: hypothetical protein ACLFPO_11895, partial [Spirochaetaceae bacterium]